jgi:hypothetical protein
MQVIEQAIKCAECKKVLQSPVSLPCGYSICKRHSTVAKSTTYNCPHCQVTHQIPDNGFPINKSLESILSTNIERIQLSSEYDDAFQAYTKLAKSIGDFHLLKKDPSCLIDSFICDLKNQIDLSREQFKHEIDEKAAEIIKDLDEYAKECQSSLVECNNKGEKTPSASNGCQRANKTQPLLTDPTNFSVVVESIENELIEIKKRMDEFKQNKHELIKLKEKCLELNKFDAKIIGEREKLFLDKPNSYKSKVFAFRHQFNSASK